MLLITYRTVHLGKKRRDCSVQTVDNKNRQVITGI